MTDAGFRYTGTFSSTDGYDVEKYLPEVCYKVGMDSMADYEIESTASNPNIAMCVAKDNLGKEAPFFTTMDASVFGWSEEYLRDAFWEAITMVRSVSQ